MLDKMDTIDVYGLYGADKFDAFSSAIIATMQQPKPLWNAKEEDSISELEEAQAITA